ncbi:hypothetical protein B0H12DRAFT_444781 [Mycena haematopus]|nr:hypothetical protein B0H12DRAFT_444781 [Mycena haematopus]
MTESGPIVILRILLVSIRPSRTQQQMRTLSYGRADGPRVPRKLCRSLPAPCVSEPPLQLSWPLSVRLCSAVGVWKDWPERLGTPVDGVGLGNEQQGWANNNIDGVFVVQWGCGTHASRKTITPEIAIFQLN